MDALSAMIHAKSGEITIAISPWLCSLASIIIIYMFYGRYAHKAPINWKQLKTDKCWVYCIDENANIFK